MAKRKPEAKPTAETYVLVCETTDVTNNFTYAEILMSAGRAKMLLRYKSLIPPLVAHDESFYCIEFFYAITWSDTFHGDVLPEDGWLVNEGPRLKQNADTAAGTMRITKDGVLWSASPKHSDGHFETQELPWGYLEIFARGNQPLAYAQKTGG